MFEGSDDLVNPGINGMEMLITQQAEKDMFGSKGVGRESFSTLREQLNGSYDITDHCRQRLLELEQRLVRVQALGDEYSRIEFSDQAMRALQGKFTEKLFSIAVEG